MASESIETTKDARELQAAYSLEGQEDEDEDSLQFNSRLKWKLDLLILPVISIVYFFAQMVSFNEQ